MRVYLNRMAAYGSGGRRWANIETDLRHQLGKMTVEELGSPDDCDHRVLEALEAGESIFVAAGGDGTVNLLLNALMKSGADTADLTIGAVGLGSSNDFHKPLAGRPGINGVPLRVATREAVPTDVICLDFVDPEDRQRTRYCLLNASVGVTAEANHRFNSRGPLLRMVSRVSVELAILVSALGTIATWRNIPCSIREEGGAIEEVAVTNLGVVKSPHFAGRLSYPVQVRADDGLLGLNLCQGMTAGAAVKVLLGLYRRRFGNRPGTRSWIAERILVESDRSFALESDGEVIRTGRVELSVVPRAVRCCP